MVTDASTYKRILIGGTGRSGTTVLYKVCRSHSDIYAFEKETRFMIDPGGLISLIHHLSDGFTVERSREAIYRFIRLMKYDLVTPEKSPYLRMDFKEYWQYELYVQAIDDFIEEITHGHYSGWIYQRMYEESYYWNGEHKGFRKTKVMVPDYSDNRVFVAKYFEDRAELEKIAGAFVDRLYSIPMSQNSNSTWCEKTPGNLYNFDVLSRMLPNALFINAMRDPRGVCQSLMKQRWAPSDMKLTATFLNQMYSMWKKVRSRISEGVDYIEIRLEELAKEARVVLDQIAQKTGLPIDFPALEELDMTKVDCWKDEIDASDVARMNVLLKDLILENGYSLDL